MRQLSPSHLYDFWRKSGGSLLCLNVGTQNIGAAISAISKYGNPTMKPIDDIQYLTDDVLLRQKEDSSYELAGLLHSLISKYSVTAMAAGCPLDRFGRGPTSRARDSIYPFFGNLNDSGKFSSMPYTLLNDRYAIEAVEFLAEDQAMHFEKSQKKSIVDTFAALQIGEEFLDTMNTEADLPSKPQKPVGLSEFVASLQQLFSVEKMTKEELYHRFFMNYEYNEQEQIEEQLDRLEKSVPGLIRKGVDHLYSIDEEKIVKLPTLMKDQSKSE